jgi:fluoride exporter
MTVALMVLAGSIGALARFEVSTRVQRRANTRFPAGIAAVNVSGALVLGLIAGYTWGADLPEMAVAIAFGFFGGYTTFSTWMVDSILLAREEEPTRLMLVANVLGVALAGLVAVALGALVGEHLLAV